MSTATVPRMPAWRNLMWVGVIGSVVAWAVAWFVVGGPSVVMVFVALAGVALAFPASRGMRLAIVGLMVAGLSMFLASLYGALTLVLPTGAQVSATQAVLLSAFPMVAAIVLLVGAVPGFRHTNSAS